MNNQSLLSDEDHAHFRGNGYLRLENVVPPELCDRVIADLWRFLERDPGDRENWYGFPSGYVQGVGGIEIYHQQSMWDVRQHPRVYQAFRELHGRDDLRVSIDRLNFTPPRREEDPSQTLHAHWDTDVDHLVPPVVRPSGRVQGVLLLADTEADQGGFECIPDIYRDFDRWLDRNQGNVYGAATRPGQRRPDITGYEMTPVPGKAGDLIIWDVYLVHGNGTNTGRDPRYAMYLSMNPPREDRPSRRLIDAWRNITPALPGFPGDPRGWEQNNNGEPAHLSELGEKLIGLRPW